MATPDLKTFYRKSALDEELRAYDPRAHAVTVIEELHRMTHDGFLFYLQRSELAVPDGDFRRSLFRTGSIVPHFKGFFVAASEGPVIIELFEDTIVDTLGVEIIPLNANRNSDNLATAKFYNADTTFIADGDPLLGGLYIPQNSGQGVTGGTGSLLAELVLKPNTDYQISFQNDPAGSGTADIVGQFSWYEPNYPEDATALNSE